MATTVRFLNGLIPRGCCSLVSKHLRTSSTFHVPSVTFARPSPAFVWSSQRFLRVKAHVVNPADVLSFQPQQPQKPKQQQQQPQQQQGDTQQQQQSDGLGSAVGDGLTLTKNCFQQVKRRGTQAEPVLRVSVSGGEGCQGHAYHFAFIQAKDISAETDRIFVGEDGSQVAVDNISLPFLLGSTIDWVEDMDGARFEVTYNPNAAASCSCKASFAPKNFA